LHRMHQRHVGTLRTWPAGCMHKGHLRHVANRMYPTALLRVAFRPLSLGNVRQLGCRAALGLETRNGAVVESTPENSGKDIEPDVNRCKSSVVPATLPHAESWGRCCAER
jgi:hypothetical protein